MLENPTPVNRSIEFSPNAQPFSAGEAMYADNLPADNVGTRRSTAEILGGGIMPLSVGSPLSEHVGRVYSGEDEVLEPIGAEPVLVEEAPVLPPPADHEGGGGKPPRKPPELGPPAGNGEGDDDSFGVGRFRDVPLTPAEILPAALVYQTGLSSTFIRHHEYVDRDDGSETIKLQSHTDDGVVDITVRKGGSLAVAFTNARGGKSHHRYYVDDNNLVRADEHDMSIILNGVPLPGEVPDIVIRSAIAKRAAVAESIRQQEQQQGITDRIVGSHEVSFINNIVRKAFPAEQTFSDMHAIAERRIHALMGPSVDDAMWAGLELNGYLEQALTKARAQRSDTDDFMRFIEHDIYDPSTRTRLQVEAGVLPAPKDGGGVPFVRLSRDQTVGRDYLDTVPELFAGELHGIHIAQHSVYLTYTAEDGLLKCAVETGLFRLDGRPLDMPQTQGRQRITGDSFQPTRCDRAEARALRNLLRRPRA